MSTIKRSVWFNGNEVERRDDINCSAAEAEERYRDYKHQGFIEKFKRNYRSVTLSKYICNHEYLVTILFD